MSKKTVVIGILGSTLDAGSGQDRWERWRPTVALCQQEDLLVDRLELISQRKHRSLVKRIREDIASVSPETHFEEHTLEFANPWDFEEVYGTLHDFARGYPFDEEKEEYLIHITTGTHVAQICLFLLTESRRLPGKLLQLSPPKKRARDQAGTYGIIDLDLSRYDRIATRFQEEKREGLSDYFFFRTN